MYPSSSYIETISGFFCNVLWALGLWKPYGKSNRSYFTYTAYSVLILSFFSISYTVFMACGIFVGADFSDLTSRLYMSLTEVALTIRVVQFFIKNREWQKILIDIKEFEINSHDEQQIMRRRVWMLQIIIFSYCALPNFAAQSYGTAPLFSDKTILAFSGWYPGFDWRNNRRDFWVIFAYQYIGIIFTSNLAAVIDTYYWFLMQMLGTQAKIFGDRLSAIKVRNGENIRRQLIRHIHMHQQLNNTLKLIQKNLQWSYFSQILMSSIVICSTTNELAKVIKHLKQFSISI